MTSISALFDSAQFLSFFVLLALGFLYLILTFVISNVGDLFGGDAAHLGADGHETISVFSPTVLAIFLVGFGAIGSIATYYRVPIVGSSVYALGAGAIMGGLGYLGTKALYGQQSNSEISPIAALNRVATVSVDIPKQGLGEVNVSVNGQYMTYMANATTDPLRRGQTVKVVSVNGSILTVQAI